jgi:sRNA-binding regulator protein Hfq
MIFKHAISTIVPPKPLDLRGGEETVSALPSEQR